MVSGGEMLTPQQANCDDCGVFTCIYANYVSADLPLGFTATDMPLFRKRITLDILRKKEDKEKKISPRRGLNSGVLVKNKRSPKWPAIFWLKGRGGYKREI